MQIMFKSIINYFKARRERKLREERLRVVLTVPKEIVGWYGYEGLMRFINTGKSEEDGDRETDAC